MNSFSVMNLFKTLPKEGTTIVQVTHSDGEWMD
jgi:ABC-type ATPase involved in cell division